MNESQITTLFAKKNKVHGVFELKIAKKKSIRFDSVKDHQRKALLKVSNKGLFHKISDFPMFSGSKTRFNFQKPFDAFYLKDTPSFVVICWYTPRKPREYYYILIEDWLEEERVSKRKSITKERSYEISLYSKLWK